MFVRIILEDLFHWDILDVNFTLWDLHIEMWRMRNLNCTQLDYGFLGLICFNFIQESDTGFEAKLQNYVSNARNTSKKYSIDELPLVQKPYEFRVKV